MDDEDLLEKDEDVHWGFVSNQQLIISFQSFNFKQQQTKKNFNIHKYNIMFYYSDVNKTLIPALVNKYLCNTIKKKFLKKREE